MKQARFFLSLAVGTAMMGSPLLAMARSSEGLPPPPTARELSTADAQSINGRTSSRSSATSDVEVSADDVEELLIDELSAEGKGYAMDAYYPYPGSGISVDASITKEVKPDWIAINAYCDAVSTGSRDEVKAQLKQTYEAIKAAVGTDGRVRRSGGYGIYPYWDPVTGLQSKDVYSGSMSIYIRVENLSASEKISDIVEQHACSPSWDVRMSDPQVYELSLLDDLVAKLNARKALFEKLLGTKLDNVIGAYMSTWVDGYSTYDPDTNTAEATTTLTVTFDTMEEKEAPSRGR